MPDKWTKARILGSIYLNLIYSEVYRSLFQISKTNSRCKVLELGSTGLEFSNAHWSDVTLTSYEDGVNAENLPFEDATFDVIVAKDVLHHLKNIPAAFAEFSRVLKPDGVIVASEPSWSFLGRFIYKFFHEEDWIVSDKFTIESDDPWVSNQALIFNLLRLPIIERKRVLSGFDIEVGESNYSLTYLLSGGVHSKTFISARMLVRIHKSELLASLRGRFVNLISLNRIVAFRRQEDGS